MASAAKRRWLALFLGAAVLVGAGALAFLRYRSPATDHAVRLVPADATGYLHVFLKPSTSQRRTLRTLLERFPATDEPEEAGSFVTDVLRDALRRFGLRVDAQAGEWLGDEAAVYLSNGAALPTLLLAVEDDDGARAEATETLGPQLDHGVAMTYAEGFLVIGEPHAVEASTAAVDGSSLDEVPSFRALVDELDAHRLALAYATDEGMAIPGEGPWLATMRALESGVVVDAVTARGPGPWRSLGGHLVAGLLDTEGTLQVDLSTPLDARALTREARARLDGAGVPLKAIAGGFEVRAAPPLPPVEMTRAGRRLQIVVGEGSGPDADLPEGLAAAARTRLGAGYAPAVVLDLSGLPAGARAPFFGPSAVSLRPALEQFLTLNLGVRETAGFDFGRLVITFSDA